MTIYKYPLAVQGVRDVSLPRNALFLDVAFQNDSLVAWFVVDTLAGLEVRRFRSVFTGEEFNAANKRYRGTAQHTSEMLVVHVFEEILGAPL